MDNNSRIKIAIACVGLTIAIGLFFLLNSGPSTDGVPQRYFYDMSKKALYTAADDGIPPVAGIDGGEADGVRAVVVRGEDGGEQIVYLEKFTPELKAAREKQQQEAAAGGSNVAGSKNTLGKAHVLIKRPDDQDWVSIASAEGEKIMAEFQQILQSGRMPIQP